MMEIYLDEVPNTEFEDKYEYVDNLAAGSFGNVVKAKDKQTNLEIAVKILNKDMETKKLNLIRQEINIFQNLNHKNIVKFLGYIETNTKIFIAMDLLKGGTIKTLLDNRKNIGKNLTEEECSIIMKHLLQAVKYLHDREIIHRDIKPENIMFKNEEDFSSLKLIDFGLSAKHENCALLSDMCGTLIYMAPEQIEKKAYSKSIDMWSCGMIMYYLLNCGKHPIYENGMSTKEFIAKLKNPNWQTKNKISKMAHSLLYKLLEVNQSLRFTVEKSLNHPWITRNKYQNIPENYFEDWRVNTIKRKFKEVFGATLFLSYFSKLNNKKKIKNEEDLTNYCTLLNQISKIHKEKFNKMRENHFDPLYASTMSALDNSINDQNSIKTIEEIKSSNNDESLISSCEKTYENKMFNSPIDTFSKTRKFIKSNMCKSKYKKSQTISTREESPSGGKKLNFKKDINEVDNSILPKNEQKLRESIIPEVFKKPQEEFRIDLINFDNNTNGNINYDLKKNITSSANHNRILKDNKNGKKYKLKFIEPIKTERDKEITNIKNLNFKFNLNFLNQNNSVNLPKPKLSENNIIIKRKSIEKLLNTNKNFYLKKETNSNLSHKNHSLNHILQKIIYSPQKKIYEPLSVKMKKFKIIKPNENININEFFFNTQHHENVEDNIEFSNSSSKINNIILPPINRLNRQNSKINFSRNINFYK